MLVILVFKHYFQEGKLYKVFAFTWFTQRGFNIAALTLDQAKVAMGQKTPPTSTPLTSTPLSRPHLPPTTRTPPTSTPFTSTPLGRQQPSIHNAPPAPLTVVPLTSQPTPAPNIVDRATATLSRADVVAASYYSPTDILNPINVINSAPGRFGLLFIEKSVTDHPSSLLTRSVDVSEKALKFVVTKPVTVGAIVGIGAGIGIGLSAVGAVAGAVGGETAVSVANAVVGGVSTAVVVKSAVDFYKDYTTTTSNVEKDQKIADAIVTASALGAGGYVGNAAFLRVQQFIRTFGRTEVPTENVVAPESLRGQNYPTVKPGTTASQLKSEFYEPALPGEVAGIARGFHASPTSFKEVDITQAGSSELKGLYSAPKLNPTFLRDGTESKPVGFNLITNVKPTAIRVQFKDIEYAPGVGPTTKVGSRSLTGLKTFFSDIAGSARTVLPAIKTEKEVITAVESKLLRTSSEFFFKTTKGVRVPIEEYDVVPKDIAVPKTTETKTFAEVSKSSSLTSSKGYNPFNPLTSSLSLNYKPSSSLSSGISTPRSAFYSAPSLSSPLSSGSGSFPSGSSPFPSSSSSGPKSSSGGSSSSSPFSSSVTSSASSYASASVSSALSSSQRKFFLNDRVPKVKYKKKKSKGRGNPLYYEPDLTSLTFNITEKVRKKDLARFIRNPPELRALIKVVK